MVSATAAATVIIGLIGLIFLTIEVNNRRNQAQESNRVSTPMFGTIPREGPWPECVGMDGSECLELIEGYAKDVRGNVFLLHEGDLYTEDFVPTRVRIFVDDDNVVTAIPDRG